MKRKPTVNIDIVRVPWPPDEFISACLAQHHIATGYRVVRIDWVEWNKTLQQVHAVRGYLYGGGTDHFGYNGSAVVLSRAEATGRGCGVEVPGRPCVPLETYVADLMKAAPVTTPEV